ncbi:MAG: ATP-binding protein [Telluria sp.]
MRVLSATICGTLMLSSIAQTVLSMREQRGRADALLIAETRLASVHIQSYLSDIVGSMTWLLDLDQPGVQPSLAEIRDYAHRLLRKVPALSQLRYVNRDGCMQLAVSRVATDREGSCAEPALAADEIALLGKARQHQLAYGPVQFRDGSEPSMTIAMTARGARGGALLATVDLRLIHATVTGIQIGKTGYAYIVDRDGHLIAHPDQIQVLRHLNLSSSAAVSAARSTGPSHSTMLLRDFGGRYVLSATTTVPGPDWWVFAHQPAREAFSPIIASLWFTLSVIVVAMITALAASYFLAQRMARPILALREGAEKMGAGALHTRLTVSTGDEIELLANEFNRMASALGESYAELEAKVRRRTHALELAGNQLRDQAAQLAGLNAELSVRLDELALRRDEADRASAAKTRFLATASHDLLQPMHAVGLMVGVLRQRIRYPEVSALVVKVEAAVQGMESLFSSLLDISKLDSHAVPVDLQVVELQKFFDYIELNYQPIAQEKGLTLRVARCRYAVRTDPALLERIISNLVSNAIRYTVHGTILLGCRRCGDAVRLLVYDTGMGIPTQFQNHIFEEFYQISGEGRQHGDGLGLGLSIVRRSAALLGLPLTLTSTVGAGSAFGITIPRVSFHAPRAASQARAYDDQDFLRGAFIVIVDDDPAACGATEELLRANGCHIVTGTSLSALQCSLDNHLRTPDLIVTDLWLGPRESGLDVIEALRTDWDHVIPALIITGDTHPPAPHELPGHCRLVRKPVSPARLFMLCRQMLVAPSPTQTAIPALPRQPPPAYG